MSQETTKFVGGKSLIASQWHHINVHTASIKLRIEHNDALSQKTKEYSHRSWNRLLQSAIWPRFLFVLYNSTLRLRRSRVRYIFMSLSWANLTTWLDDVYDSAHNLYITIVDTQSFSKSILDFYDLTVIMNFQP